MITKRTTDWLNDHTQAARKKPPAFLLLRNTLDYLSSWKLSTYDKKSEEAVMQGDMLANDITKIQIALLDAKIADQSTQIQEISSKRGQRRKCTR